MKITKTKIKKVFTGDITPKKITELYKLAHNMGYSTKDKKSIFLFILKYSHSLKYKGESYNIAYNPSIFKNKYLNISRPYMPIRYAIQYAKWQTKENFNYAYMKILIEGNKHIWWAHNDYRHEDYNKSIAFPNTEKYRKAMKLINEFINIYEL